MVGPAKSIADRLVCNSQEEIEKLCQLQIERLESKLFESIAANLGYGFQGPESRIRDITAVASSKPVSSYFIRLSVSYTPC